MSNFNLENALMESIRLDGPLQQGPPMRWQRAGNTSLHSDSMTPVTSGSAPTCEKQNIQAMTKGPSDPKCSYPLTNMENVNPDDPTKSPATAENQRRTHQDGQKQRAEAKILALKQKAPSCQEGYASHLSVLYSTSAVKNNALKSSSQRHIPHQADRVLDAPELLDDYYLNLMSWSSTNQLAIALGSNVYLSNVNNGLVSLLTELENSEEYVCSVAWSSDGNILAVGINTGIVQLWDVSRSKLVRSMAGHTARVGCLAWNTYLLSSGGRTGHIHHHDVRQADHKVGSLNGHSQEVCGLSWSADGQHLASGANDNLVCVWNRTMGHPVEPVQMFTLHQAAVKALAWCPWQDNLLASGGGTADRSIRLWNISNGTCMNTIDAGSQVSALLWSKDYKELISGHGYSQNQLTIWKYPSMVKIADLTGHLARVLCLALSPDGSTVASAAADETIRLWKCFAIEQRSSTSKKLEGANSKQLSSSKEMAKSIR